MSGDEGARDANEWLSRLRSRTPYNLSEVSLPISKHMALMFSCVTCESVSVSITAVALKTMEPFLLSMTVQLGPKQDFNGHSGSRTGLGEWRKIEKGGMPCRWRHRHASCTA